MLPVPDFKQKPHHEFDLVGKIKVKLLVILAGIAVVLISVQLVFANNLAVEGEKVSRINQELQQLEAENINLRVKIAQESSLTNLTKKAQASGFEKPQKVIFF